MTEIADRDLVALPLPQDALSVFTTEGAIDPYLARIREAIDAFAADPSTEAGRKEIKSFAFRIAKAKTALEAEGKRLADEQKEIPKKIDATRKRIKDTLDAWRDEVRKPVDDFEAAEAAEKAQRDLEAKAAAERAADERRLANKKHRAKIDKEILEALVAAQVPQDMALVFIALVASKAVPHVSISY
jgi:hypothetical protein